MANNRYTDRLSIVIDLKLYLSFRNNTVLDLSVLPKLAADRWPWLYANWDSKYKNQFKEFANGDSYLTAAVDTIQNHVNGWINGSGVNPFANVAIFADLTELLALIKVPDLSPTQSENLYISQEIQRVSTFNYDTFKTMRDFLKSQRDVAFDFIGLSDPLYNQYRNRDTSPKQRDFFVSDLDQLSQVIDIERFIEGIMLEFKFQKDIEPDLLAFANQQLALNASDVRAEDIYTSYFMIPFEQSLEQMAQDYLGDKNKWYELITINKLKPPYVDIYGEKVLLLQNASANSLRIPINLQEKFRVGSTIKIGSRTVPEEVRKVEQFNDNLDGSATLFLSGAPDLAKLRTNHVAYVRVYIPETINDFTFVKIPVTITSPYADVPTPTRADLRKLDKALYAFGVDIARDDRTGDIVIGTNGDLGLQFGIPNVRQAVLAIVKTGIGELPLHPNFGLPNTTGIILEGAETATRIAAIIEQSVKRDQRFTSVIVDAIEIASDGRINMKLKVSVAGSDQLIPLAFVI